MSSFRSSFFPKKQTAEPTNFPDYPGPTSVMSDEHASMLMDEVGRLQREMELEGKFRLGAPNEMISRIEGVLLYYSERSVDFALLYEKIMDPFTWWCIHIYTQHPDYVNNVDSYDQRIRQHLMELNNELRSRYDHLR